MQFYKCGPGDFDLRLCWFNLLAQVFGIMLLCCWFGSSRWLNGIQGEFFKTLKSASCRVSPPGCQVYILAEMGFLCAPFLKGEVSGSRETAWVPGMRFCPGNQALHVLFSLASELSNQNNEGKVAVVRQPALRASLPLLLLLLLSPAPPPFSPVVFTQDCSSICGLLFMN